MNKRCDRCFQTSPVASFDTDAKMVLGRRNTCSDCSWMHGRKLKAGQVDRNVDRHNRKILLEAWPKMPHKGIGYDIDAKVDIQWDMALFRYDLFFRLYDSKGRLTYSKCWNSDLAVSDKIKWVVNFLNGMGIRLELDTYTRELTKRVIYIY